MRALLKSAAVISVMAFAAACGPTTPVSDPAPPAVHGDGYVTCVDGDCTNKTNPALNK